MTKKLRRQIIQAFNEEGRTRGQEAVFDGHAVLQIENGGVLKGHIALITDHNYTKEALDELIAELLFLKEEWEEHPVYLEQEQAEDMEEIAEEEWPAAPADFDLEEDQPNPFENVANQVEPDRHIDIYEEIRQAREALYRR